MEVRGNASGPTANLGSWPCEDNKAVLQNVVETNLKKLLGKGNCHCLHNATTSATVCTTPPLPPPCAQRQHCRHRVHKASTSATMCTTPALRCAQRQHSVCTPPALPPPCAQVNGACTSDVHNGYINVQSNVTSICTYAYYI